MLEILSGLSHQRKLSENQIRWQKKLPVFDQIPHRKRCIGGRGCGGDLTSQVFHGTGSCGIQAATMVPLWLTCHFERSAASNIQDGRWCGFKGKGFQRSQPVNKLSSRQKNGPYSSLLCSLPCIPRPLPFLWTSFQGKQTFNIFLESIFYEI